MLDAMVKGHTVRLARDGRMSFLVFSVIVFSSADESGLLVTVNCCRQKGMLDARSEAMVFMVE